MNRLLKGAALGAALIAMTAGAASAHRAWILPSATVVSGDNAGVTIDAAASNNLFYPDHRPMQPAQIAVTGPDGKAVTIDKPHVGQYRTSFDIKLPAKGTYRIANASSGVNAQWKEGTETKRARGTMAELVAQGVDKKPGVEFTVNNRRVETFVTNGAPSAVPATNKGLELTAVTHFNDLYEGEAASFKVLNDGKPAANIEIVIIAGGDRYRSQPEEMKLKTDAQGVLKVTFAKPGMYWLEAETSGTTTFEGKTMKSQSSYVAVLEVLPG